MAKRIYTTKDVLSMLDTDSGDDFEGYVDEEEYVDECTGTRNFSRMMVFTRRTVWPIKLPPVAHKLRPRG